MKISSEPKGKNLAEKGDDEVAFTSTNASKTAEAVESQHTKSSKTLVTKFAEWQRPALTCGTLPDDDIRDFGFNWVVD